MKIRFVIQIFVLGLLFLVSACRPYHATPFAALTEWPGYLENADEILMASVEVIKEESVAGGLVIIYSMPSEETGKKVLVRTFVTPEGRGWRPQASSSVEYSNSENFVVHSTNGGNITPVTTVYGLSRKGDTIRIEWGDGQIDIVPIVDGAFVLSRPATLTILKIELLDVNGTVLESKEFG